MEGMGMYNQERSKFAIWSYKGYSNFDRPEGGLNFQARCSFVSLFSPLHLSPVIWVFGVIFLLSRQWLSRIHEITSIR